MKHLEINHKKYHEVVDQTVSILQSGGIAIVPFDTVYGIICDARNDRTIEKVFTIKQRDISKPLGITIDNLSRIAKYLIITPERLRFIEDKIPGPYTFIVTVNHEIPLSQHCMENGTVGFRIPNKPLIRDICHAFGRPLAQTSANISGMGNCYSYEDLVSQYGNTLDQVDLIIDEGPIARLPASTLYNLTREHIEIIER